MVSEENWRVLDKRAFFLRSEIYIFNFGPSWPEVGKDQFCMEKKQEKYLLDQTGQQKIGRTTYIVSSFLRAEKSPAFMDILGALLKQELKIS